MIEKAFENLDPKAEKRIKELTDEVERLALFNVSQQCELLKFAEWLDNRRLTVKHIGVVNLLDEYKNFNCG